MLLPNPVTFLKYESGPIVIFVIPTLLYLNLYPIRYPRIIPFGVSGLFHFTDTMVEVRFSIITLVGEPGTRERENRKVCYKEHKHCDIFIQNAQMITIMKCYLQMACDVRW